MYLSRLILNPRSRAVQRDLADIQEQHRTLMTAFPPAPAGQAAREAYGVLYRLEEDRRRGRLTLLVQSLVLPDWSRLPSDYLLADTSEENPAVKEVGHIYQAITAGAVFAFRLRANPTRKIDTKSGPDGRRRHGRRVELVREADQIAWLQRQGQERGFALLSVRVSGLNKNQGHRRAGAARLTLASLVFEGLLRVTDPQQFLVRALCQGIGPGKAYGCGLLSLAPP